MTKENMVRLQIDLTPSQRDWLEKLMKETGSSTKRECVLSCMTFMEWAIKEKKKGNSIISLNQKTNEKVELVIPAFLSF